MQRIILFFFRNKDFLLFFLLFLISVFLTINSHSYHKNKFVTSANFFSGGIYSFRSSITEYFDLKKQNRNLVEENRRLRTLLQNKNVFNSIYKDSITIDSTYRFISAKIINNNFSKTKNNLTLNKGSNDGLNIDTGVISSQGVVGIINSVSKNYASVQSILNTNSQIVAKFKKSDHFGTLFWNAEKPNIVQLKEIPRIAPVAVGDTIITDGKSTIFPEGILIGKVIDFQREDQQDYYHIDIELFTDMTSVKHVYTILHLDAPEIKQLEKEVDNEE